MSISSLDAHEDKAIETLVATIKNVVPTMSDEAFKRCLLQRGQFSFHGFTPAYDFAETIVSDPEALKVIREVRQEEYPLKKSSHRTDLIVDLQTIGVSNKDIFSVRSDSKTQQSIDKLLELFRWKNNHVVTQIRSLVGLRVGFEIFVAEEYDLFLREIERRFDVDREYLVFYPEHVDHDKKTTPLGGTGRSHSDRFSMALMKCVKGMKNGEQVAREAIDEVLAAKTSFYKS